MAFEEGNVEVILRIDLEEAVKNRIGAPRRPAPLRPDDASPPHSRASSHESLGISPENNVSQHLTSEALARHAQMNNDNDELDEDKAAHSYARINGILSGQSVVKENSPTPVFEQMSDAAKEALSRKLQMRNQTSKTRSAAGPNGTHSNMMEHNGNELQKSNSNQPPRPVHKPTSSASNILDPYKRRSHTNANRASQTPTQFRPSVAGGGIAAQEWVSLLRRKVIENFGSNPSVPRSPNEHALPQYVGDTNPQAFSPHGHVSQLSSSSFKSLSHASSHEGSIISISEIDKYLDVDENGNSKIPEELKSSQEQLKNLQRTLLFLSFLFISKHNLFHKHKQLHIRYATEKKQWQEKIKELQDQVAQMEQTLKNTQRKLREKVEQNTLLRDQFQMLQQQFSELPAQTQAEAQERVKFRQQEQMKLQQSQQALYNQIDVQRQQMVQLQGALEQQRFTIEALQKELDQSKEKIKNLEKKLEEAQSNLAKQGKSRFSLCLK
ncbi:hypothetical protein RFI_20938 [Reticulomyxa filosa]|uniref:Uncharacterized protein n=1 Tax=Reticulomyxa filosa TaxID=46433 RepID=X6MSJ9_RETFI|nr:hypothetical protein RFI_20938 [Reticulomyxa filosa]|eukprot:ETO16402.1 hypothetical protein RFI_20938 [Reticulomyxa filosa]